jgi:hypothetical protein
METIRTPLGEVDLSYDWRQYFRNEINRVIGHAIREIASKGGLNPAEIIDERVDAIMQLNLEEAVRYVERSGFPKPRSVRMLLAHGNSWNDTEGTDFIYHEVNADGTEAVKRVQNWVDEHDGKYNALFVQACNPAGVEISTRRSFLVYPVAVNNSQEILWASMGIGNKILEVKPPVNYRGVRQNDDPLESMLAKYSLSPKPLFTF